MRGSEGQRQRPYRKDELSFALAAAPMRGNFHASFCEGVLRDIRYAALDGRVRLLYPFPNIISI